MVGMARITESMSSRTAPLLNLYVFVVNLLGGM